MPSRCAVQRVRRTTREQLIYKSRALAQLEGVFQFLAQILHFMHVFADVRPAIGGTRHGRCDVTGLAPARDAGATFGRRNGFGIDKEEEGETTKKPGTYRR